MATSLQTYINQTNPAYDAQKKGIQNQINAIPNQLTGALNSITDQFNIDKGNLDRQRDNAADQASKSAAARGGTFSGMANLANKDYYDNSFVPAITQLNRDFNANQTSARQNYDNRRFDLENALNSLSNEQYKYAQSLYQADLDREAQLRAQREAAAIQAKSLAGYYGGGSTAAPKEVGRMQRGTNKGTDMSGFYFYDAAGKPITAAQYAKLNSSNTSINEILNHLAQQGDRNAQLVLAGTANNAERAMLGLPALVNNSSGGTFRGVGATR